MDWRFRKNALGRWIGLLTGFLEGLVLRESECDLLLLYRFLDDLFFLGGLQDICAEEWVDEFLDVARRANMGSVVKDANVGAPVMCICMVRQSVDVSQNLLVYSDIWDVTCSPFLGLRLRCLRL